MTTAGVQTVIKVLVADDDEHVLDCYKEAFSEEDQTGQMKVLDELSAELFNTAIDIRHQPKFDVVACNQGEDAIRVATAAREEGDPFDVIILDVRMPPGIDGVETGSKIRQSDPDVKIVFVSGFSDVPFEELQRRVPPPMHLHYFNKPLSFAQLAEDVISMIQTR